MCVEEGRYGAQTLHSWVGELGLLVFSGAKVTCLVHGGGGVDIPVSSQGILHLSDNHSYSVNPMGYFTCHSFLPRGILFSQFAWRNRGLSGKWYRVMIQTKPVSGLNQW